MVTDKQSTLFEFDANEYPLDPGIRLLEASAGTGKTFALAHLVLRLITERAHSINEILVVTFTEAAAAELKARIGSRLEDALQQLEAPQKVKGNVTPDAVLKTWVEQKAQENSDRLRFANLIIEALENLDRADITTIHGFCKRTLKREALSNTSTMSPLIEEDNKELILEVVHDYWLKEVLKLNPKDLKGVVNAGLSPESLIMALTKVDSDVSLDIGSDLQEIDISEPLRERFKSSLIKRWRDFVINWTQQGKDLDVKLKEQAMQWRIEGANETKPFSPKPRKNRYEILNRWVESFNLKVKDSDQAQAPSYGEIRNQILLSNYFHPATFCETARRCGENKPSLINDKLQTSIAELWDGPAEDLLRHGLVWTLSALKERRIQRGVMSFGDLLRTVDPGSLTTKSSEESTALINKLRLRYRVALIDEFQDTDLLQWRLLKQCFGTRSKHTLVMVGDPKQAIYSFRGGDLNTYRKAREEVDRIDALLDNYRNTELLMKSINQFMSPGLRRSYLKVLPLNPSANKKGLELSPTDYPLQILTLDKLCEVATRNTSLLPSKTTIEKLIPNLVANEILELLNSSSKKLNPSDICILVGRHEQASEIREGLALAGLPSRLINQGDVLTSEAGKVLQYFLDCLANPGDSGNLRLIASSSLMQWNARELAESNTNGELDKLSVRFKKLSRALPKLGLLGCLAEFLEGRTIAELSERGRMLSDLQQCGELIQEAIHLYGLDSLRAARWLKKQRLNPVGSIPTDRQPHSDVVESAINVVTIHRSKGLEFRIVFCPYLWQTPPFQKGPLWSCRKTHSWIIALNKGWGKGRKASEEANNTALEEAERLAYVAITRSCERLFIYWASCLNQEGNPLTSFLFGPDNLNTSLELLTPERMTEWIKSNNVPATIKSPTSVQITSYWQSPKPQGELQLGPIPDRQLDRCWGRHSYSSWINTEKNAPIPPHPLMLDEGRDLDPQIKEIKAEQKLNSKTIPSEAEYSLNSQDPLSHFPRGAVAGNCLHKILEKLDYRTSLYSKQSKTLIVNELRRSGLDTSFLRSVQDGLTNVFNTSLGSSLGNLKLSQLDRCHRMNEINFDLAIAQKGKPITALDLSSVFLLNPEARFSSKYAQKLCSLDLESQGILTGSIDLVFTDNKDNPSARWWVADWKSNWIGKLDDNNEIISCGPIDYHEEAMEEQMIFHNYPLQAHLYLVTLHRFLKWRLPNYNPTNHLGGYVYVFLRGLPGGDYCPRESDKNNIPGLIIESAPLERVLELDRLLKEGGK